jgi:hypothetical protein
VRDERGTHTSFDAAPGVTTLALDINDRGTAVGYYGLTEAHGFARRPTGTVTTIDVPGASNTFVYGTNDDGQVVGSYVDADGREHSFLLERGAMTVVDHPDAPDDPPPPTPRPSTSTTASRSCCRLRGLLQGTGGAHRRLKVAAARQPPLGGVQRPRLGRLSAGAAFGGISCLTWLPRMVVPAPQDELSLSSPRGTPPHP